VALADALAGDARLAMAGALVVGRTEAVEPEHPRAAPGELIGHCCADRATADHDHVRTAHPGLPFRPSTADFVASDRLRRSRSTCVIACLCCHATDTAMCIGSSGAVAQAVGGYVAR